MKVNQLSLLIFSLVLNLSSAKTSTNGKCGPKNGNTTCPGNECCNSDGKCGFDKNYCGVGCQSKFGYCLPENYKKMHCSSCIECVDCDKKPFNALICPSTCKKKLAYSTVDGTCGPNKICPNNQCCNKYGRCGTSESYCSLELGCQYSYGRCDKSKNITTKKKTTTTKKKTTSTKKKTTSTKKKTTSTKKKTTTTKKKTTSTKRKSTTTKVKTTNKYLKPNSYINYDNKCGPENGNTVCHNSMCCSKYGNCGTSEKYCDISYGCQVGFGRCYEIKAITVKKSKTSKSTSSPTSSSNKCGPSNGNRKCPDDKCCSKYGNCGTSIKYCDVDLGCQVGFGRCE